MSLASQREPLPTGSGRGAHLHLPKTPPLGRHGQDGCGACFLRTQAGKSREMRAPHVGTRRYERRKQRGVATWNVRAVVRRSSAPRGQTVQVFYCVKLYSKSAPSNSIFEAGQVQGKGRPQGRQQSPRGTCTLQSCGQGVHFEMSLTSSSPSMRTCRRPRPRRAHRS